MIMCTHVAEGKAGGGHVPLKRIRIRRRTYIIIIIMKDYGSFGSRKAVVMYTVRSQSGRVGASTRPGPQKENRSPYQLNQ